MRYDSNQECALPVMPMLESIDKRMRWLTVSCAADKSSRIITEDLVVALASFKVSVIANRAVSVEWPLHTDRRVSLSQGWDWEDRAGLVIF